MNKITQRVISAVEKSEDKDGVWRSDEGEGVRPLGRCNIQVVATGSGDLQGAHCAWDQVKTKRERR